MNQNSASENYQLGNPKASYGPNRENTIFLLIGISLCAVGGLVLPVVGFGQSYIRDRVILPAGGLLLLLIGVRLYFVYQSQRRIGVEVYADGFVLTDRRNQRHLCRWDDVTEVYEMLILRDPARPGRTPLVFAVNAGYVRMTKLLIQAGADVHHQVPAGQNGRGDPVPARRLLDFARGKRAQSIVKLLRDAGAN